MDWICYYIRIDIDGQNVDKKTGFRKERPKTKRDFWWYKPNESNLPGPFRDEYLACAWSHFWLPATWWNNQNVTVTITERESGITYDEQELVDKLWCDFLDTGDTPDEKGYNLNQMPERLSVAWGQSCLIEKDAPRYLHDQGPTRFDRRRAVRVARR